MKGKTAFFFLMALIFSGAFITCAKKQHFELSRFISAETCGGCHDTIYAQWKNSMHNQAHTDELYNAVAKYYLKGLSSKDEMAEAESCVKCHTPIGVVTGFPLKTSDDLNKAGDIPSEGIQCDYCHSATGADKPYNNGIVLDPGHGDADPGVKRGPFKDSESDYHKSAYSAFHEDAKICGNCHDVRHVVFGTKLETTYEEWQNSPFNSKDPAKRITCQGCHMYQRPGVPATGSTERPVNPGTASSGSRERPHIFTHYFVGGNSFLAHNDDPGKMKLAEERLKNAAVLTIDDSAVKNGTVVFDIKNTGAGHYLPTGLTDTRQMWLEIIIRDASGKTLYESGRLNRDGYIPAGSFVYNTIFGDGKGNPVRNIAQAREILKDKRVPPGESLREIVKLPATASKNISIEVRLLYRLAAQELVDEILGKGKMKLPVVTMAETKKSVKL
ncbi:MAG: cytochrome c554 family protein [Spirochaetae bacterium HGW-Spirochaetae-1]|jgi:hypothetical protein|nr:MAG: cytochrome c554 family protein [Spirochaetae bacterium HGW-Spirochaetae-1]